MTVPFRVDEWPPGAAVMWPVRPRCASPAWGGKPALPAPRRALRLLVAFALTVTVVCGLGWLGLPPGPAAVPAETDVVRVGAGETVWDVARRVAPASEPRAVVQRIRELNGLVGSAIQPGQQLEVPSAVTVRLD